VLLVREVDGHREPAIASGTLIAQDLHTEELALPDYFVRRILTTLDGDTRPEFVAGVPREFAATAARSGPCRIGHLVSSMLYFALPSRGAAIQDTRLKMVARRPHLSSPCLKELLPQRAVAQ